MTLNIYTDDVFEDMKKYKPILILVNIQKILAVGQRVMLVILSLQIKFKDKLHGELIKNNLYEI